jgi:hypothetical protein
MRLDALETSVRKGNMETALQRIDDVRRMYRKMQRDM